MDGRLRHLASEENEAQPLPEVSTKKILLNLELGGWGVVKEVYASHLLTLLSLTMGQFASFHLACVLVGTRLRAEAWMIISVKRAWVRPTDGEGVVLCCGVMIGLIQALSHRLRRRRGSAATRDATENGCRPTTARIARLCDAKSCVQVVQAH